MIIISDEFHINKRNFKALFDYFDEKKINSFAFADEWKSNSICGRVGNYRSCAKDIRMSNYVSIIDQAIDNKDELYNFKYKNIELWPLVKSELSAFTISESYNNDVIYPYNSDDLFDFHYKHYIDDLILAYSVACYWIDVFKSKESDIWKCKAAFVFSGSYIYTKVLLTMLKKSPVRAYVIESTFMGISFYCDEQYEHLPNNYLHQYENRRNKAISEAGSTLLIKDENDKLDYLRSKALNKFMIINNKNVNQPMPDSIPRFNDITKKSVLLVCQVVNDFSILESEKVVNSIEHYKSIILEVLHNTDYNMVIKTHPWERKKIHLYNSMTLNKIDEFILGLDDCYKGRIYINDDINIYHLFSNINYILTYCSQSGIEAAVYGKKVIVNDECSYAKCGFTKSYSNISDIPDLLEDSGDLNIDEFSDFLDFFVAYDHMCIFDEKQSSNKLNNLLSSPPKLAEYHRAINETSISPFYN